MTGARVLAEGALRTYLSDPGAARASAEQSRASALETGDWSVASLSERALGLVAGHLSDSTAARRHLGAAVRYGDRAHDRGAAARARADLAYVLVRCGRSLSALRAIDRAQADLPRADVGDLLAMRALVQKSLGNWDAALDAYGEALPLVRAAGDQQALAVLLCNRGVLQIHRGRPREAERDLQESAALFADLGSGLSRAIIVHNLGYVAAMRGAVPLALARYDEAEAGYAEHREVPLELHRDRGELLLAAGLAAEARQAAQKAVDAASARREPAELAEAQLRLAQAALADGDPGTAQRVAEQAARALVRQRRPGWAALAHWTRLLACAAERPGSVTEATLRRAAERLERAGWPDAALQARLHAGEQALARGRTATAHEHLRAVSSARRGGPVWHRQLGWHAEAQLRASAGDRTGALRAVARGLDLTEEHRATLGATDLRAAASGRVAALAAVGLRQALAGGRPATVWRWAERTRAAALLYPPVQPPEDEAVDAALADLRTVVRRQQEGAAAGRPDPDLAREQIELEERIRQTVRRAGGDGRGSSADLDPERLLATLGDRALVEFAASDGRLCAVVAAGGRLRLHPLGNQADVRRELHHLFFALRRMAGPAVPGHAVRERLTVAADRLDAVLLRPLARDLGDRDLVVVPTEPLHALPWSLLPSCRGRSVSVSPSATLWRTAVDAAQRPTGRTVLAAGPGLVHAEPEIAELARLHPGAQVFTGAASRVPDVLAAMADADLVHLAAHGRFRGDNPQFSAIDLGDGPLTGYDIERLPQSPAVAVLSACETGQSSVLAGGELLGLAAALLSVGVRSVVAPVLQVPDAQTAPLMVALHRGLRAGLPVAAALAAAVEAAAAGSDADLATGASFICVGA